MIFFGAFPIALYETRVRTLLASKVAPAIFFVGFILQYFVLEGGSKMVLKNLVLTPDAGLSYRLLTHLFVTPGIACFAVDLLFLWLFLAAVENRMGTRRALLVFAAGLVAGTTLQALGNTIGLTETYRAGPSAGVYGLIGAFLVLMPFADARIAYFFWLFLFFFRSGIARFGAIVLIVAYLFLPQMLAFWMPFMAIELARNTAQMAFYNAFPWPAILGGLLAGGGLAAAWYGFSGMTETEEERAMREGHAARALRREIGREQAQAARLESERAAAAVRADASESVDAEDRLTDDSLNPYQPRSGDAKPIQWDSGVPDIPQIDLHLEDPFAAPPSPPARLGVPVVAPTSPDDGESRRRRFRVLAEEDGSESDRPTDATPDERDSTAADSKKDAPRESRDGDRR